MSDHDERVTTSEWALLGVEAASAQDRQAAGPGDSQVDRLPPPDEMETMPASLYDINAATSRRSHASRAIPIGVGSALENATTAAGALEAMNGLSSAYFTTVNPEDLVTTKDKLLAATLSLLSRHDASRLSRDHFASNTLYRNAVSSSTSGRSHAMQMMLAISRIEGISPKHLIMACEPPLGLDIHSGRYVMSVLGNGVHAHHVSLFVVRMLARALTTFWTDSSLNAREQAYKHLPMQTAELYF